MDEGALEARIATDPKDFEARLRWPRCRPSAAPLARCLCPAAGGGAARQAEARKAARDKLVEWFPLCPDPKAVTMARRELSMYLNWKLSEERASLPHLPPCHCSPPRLPAFPRQALLDIEGAGS